LKIPAGLDKGLDVLARHIKHLKDIPGVYFFKDEKKEILYIGKAKNLKKRVKSYLRWDGLPVRKQRMVSQIATIDTLVTTTETEALLLEVNLIKKHKPPYNILLKDDKSFPYLQLTGEHPYPCLKIYRGSRKEPGRYFGPFASTASVHETYETLQKVFLLRTCSDNIFENRTRPCLLYDIKRCSAPCVGKVSEQEYDGLIRGAENFFKGKTKNIQENLAKRMMAYSSQRQYEKAAILRDRIASLTKIQEHQAVNLSTTEDLHIHALYRQGNKICVQVAFYQAGKNFGSKPYFPTHIHSDMTNDDIMSAFLMQFYERHKPPKNIITSHELLFKSLVQEALSFIAEHKVTINIPKSGQKKEALNLVQRNAVYSLEDQLKEEVFYEKALIELQSLLKIEKPIRRIETYDNSHLMGTHPCGVMVAANEKGFQKNAYRKFSIKDSKVNTSDDYAMMAYVMKRRFSTDEKTITTNNWPDVILIDGGPGQLSAVKSFFQKMNVENEKKPYLLAIAKGKNRNAGDETLYLNSGEKIKLERNSSLLFFLQRLRDESHRFAITTHRNKKKKDVKKSLLDQVPNIGAKRKKSLLLHFGSVKAVIQASPSDLKAVEGINSSIAQGIYDYFHSS